MVDDGFGEAHNARRVGTHGIPQEHVHDPSLGDRGGLPAVRLAVDRDQVHHPVDDHCLVRHRSVGVEVQREGHDRHERSWGDGEGRTQDIGGRATAEHGAQEFAASAPLEVFAGAVAQKVKRDDSAGIGQRRLGSLVQGPVALDHPDRPEDLDVVVLPAPLGPSSANTSPAWTCRSMPSTACVSPYVLRRSARP